MLFKYTAKHGIDAVLQPLTEYNMSFEIQSGVPIPRRTAGRSGSKYPFLQMDVDQMFTVDTGVKAATVRSAVGAFTKRNPGAGKFAVRAFTGADGKQALGVWRIE